MKCAVLSDGADLNDIDIGFWFATNKCVNGIGNYMQVIQLAPKYYGNKSQIGIVLSDSDPHIYIRVSTSFTWGKWVLIK